MTITEELLEAYLATEYRVFAPDGIIVLKARGLSAELARLQASFDVNNSAFITAYNPYSQPTDDTVNQHYQEHLIAAVNSRWQYLPGEGVDPSGKWPVEPSLLILGIRLIAALELGRKFHQHAIIFADVRGRTDLLFCQVASISDCQ